MKAKSLFSLAIIVMALAGCSENEITEQNPDANKPIGFDTYTAAQARGAENGLPAVKTSGFGVMAYQTNGAYSTAGAKSEFMNNQKVTWNSSGNAWVYSPVKFWPAGANDKISFFAYAPYAGSNGITPVSADASNNPKVKFELQTNQKNMVDLVVSDPTDGSNNTMDKNSTSGTVNFKFLHQLTRVAMEAKTGTDISANTDTKVFITAVSLVHTSKLNSKGTLDMKALTWASNTSDYLASPYALTAASSNGILNLTAANFAGYTTSSIDISSAGTTATSLFPANEYLFLLPVSNVTGTAAAGDVQVKIAYDMVNKTGAATHTKSSVEKTVNLPAGVFKKGTAQKFTFTVSLNAISFNVTTVEGWGTESDTPVTVQ